jgi:hypothetical protein
MRTTAWLLAGMLAVAPVAWAHDCPNLMNEIDEILESTPTLDEETIVDEEMRKSVKELRTEGEELHEAGKHSESVETLERALTLLKEEAG